MRILTDNPDEDDEGRAMARVLHSVAPGAAIVFAAAGPEDGAKATSIDDLVAAGATVIVDDVQGEDERAFRRGPSGAAVQRAVDAGVFYVTAAGKYG
ncbi:hypothetical protein [Subtercola boreus]|uniref:hypothetical protein n=1 Tax=Subtercola boreus TaxID=120213 RepID=UPI0011C04125|nr:hypothetical protein [Subtercola boreus]